MNVFVLTTGRAGSTTFSRACAHLANYTAAHQSRSNVIGLRRLDYPDNHIEADNRLSWFLGRLDEAYGARAFYVHLHRDPEATARSFLARFGSGILGAYYPGIVARNTDCETPDKELPEDLRLALCRDYVETVNANIRAFLRHRPNSGEVVLEDPRPGFATVLERIGATGDLDAALGEWDVSYNANRPTAGAYELRPQERIRIAPRALPRKILRVIRKLPRFVLEA